jgi:hypothetical protein
LNRFVTILLVACSIVCVAQSSQIKSGATVYIEPMDGYETYLAAALVKKQVPLIVVADKDKAEYIVKGEVSHTFPSQPAVIVNTSSVNNTTVNSANVTNGGNDAWEQSKERAQARAAARAALGLTSASISIVDAKSSQIVFAYSVGKSRNTNQEQSAAEACAKHLKEFIAKSNK